MAKFSRNVLADIQVGVEELGRREMHPLKVYRPTEFQLPIHESSSEELLVSGGKRSGKTLASTMEFGSRVLGIPITRPDGRKIPLRFRKPHKGHPQLVWVIGLNVDHIGQTLYPRLFMPGLGCNFRVIQDAETRQWRAYNENSPEDKDRYAESAVCPPMIGEEHIVPDSWHFESRAGNVFKQVRLKNGVTICAYPSTGDRPKMGDAVYGIWIDEDIASPHFIKEWQDRLITVNGWLIWSVWPQMNNFALIDAMDRAKAHEDDEKPPIQMFRLEGSKNPYNSAEGIQRGLDRMDSEEDSAHRDRGDIESLLGQRLMYDFATAIHVIRSKEIEKAANIHDFLCSLLRRFGRLPDEWTRYLAIDPSNTRTACLMGVVPPPEWEGVDMGRRLIIEDELVLKRHTPAMFADKLLPKVGHRRYEAFVMDQQIGRQTTVGSDVTVFESYGNQLAMRGIQSSLTGTSFIPGCPDKVRRRRTVRFMLEPGKDYWPQLFLVENRTPETYKEFSRYRKKEMKIGDKIEIVDDAMNERAMDCMQALEYLCQYVHERFMAGNAFVDQTYAKGRGSGAYYAAMAMRDTLQATSGSGYVHFGPGAHA